MLSHKRRKLHTYFPQLWGDSPTWQGLYTTVEIYYKVVIWERLMGSQTAEPWEDRGKGKRPGERRQ